MAQPVISQEQLDRSAAAIAALTKGRRRAKAQEKLDGIPRYAFVEVGGHLFAVPARRGSKIGIVVGGVSYPVRAPKTAAEKAAVLRTEMQVPAAPTPKAPDTAAIMAQRILVGAQRNPPQIFRSDFHQVGLSDAEIDAHRDRAMALARRLDPQIDAMLSMPVAA